MSGDGKVCTKCGHENSKYSPACEKCGSLLSTLGFAGGPAAIAQNPPEASNLPADALIESSVGTSRTGMFATHKSSPLNKQDKIIMGILGFFMLMGLTPIAGQMREIAPTGLGLGLVLLILLIAIYFLPSGIAFNKGKNNAGAILVLNLFLGWTIIGWVGALVWACSKDQPAVTVPIAVPAPPSPSLPSVDTRPCPDCAETIKAAARKCRFCGAVFSEPDASYDQSPAGG
jgi:Superinfection immunity protein/Uncharacterised protein family UPF0547